MICYQKYKRTEDKAYIIIKSFYIYLVKSNNADMKKIWALIFVFAAFGALAQNDSVSYHDYGFESQYGASGAYPAEDYLQMVVRVTPPYYPAQLVGVRVWFRNAAQPSFYKVLVRSDATASSDANNSGQLYISASPITNPSSGGAPDSAYSDYVDLSAANLIFNSGDIYAGISQNLQFNGFVGFALDTNSAIALSNRHWISTSHGTPGSWSIFSSWAFTYANFGITAFFNPVSTTSNEIKKNEVKVFPNPVDELLFVAHPAMHEKTEVKIFDSAERLIYESQYPGDIMINTAAWDNGLYFIQTRNEKTSARLKVMIIH